MMEPLENPGNFPGKAQERDTSRPTRAGRETTGNAPPCVPGRTHRYVVRDDYGMRHSLDAPDLDWAMREATMWATRYLSETVPDVPPEEGTTWETAYLESPDGTVRTLAIPIDPVEPSCVAGPHRWGPRRAYGHGGGVLVDERCDRCGLSRITDTWAQNPETGQQGLLSVRYVRREPLEED